MTERAGRGPLLWIALSLALSGVAAAQSASGYVEDAGTGDRLAGASVVDEASGRGVAANAYGFFSLPLVGDSLSLRVTSVGYVGARVRVGPGRTEVRLVPDAGVLGEATVEARAVVAAGATSARLSAADVARVPALLGEADPMKALQRLPGVLTGAEGSSGLYVRGGTPGQNLILLDGATVYNGNHAFGLVSVFNPDALQSVEVVRGGFPARYGGRLSSVVDVALREGRTDRRSGRVSVGLLASRALVEGPLGGRGGYVVAGRRSYVDALLLPLFAGTGVRRGFALTDASAKAHFDLGARTRLFASIYGGRDVLVSNEREQFDNGFLDRDEGRLAWSSATASVRVARLLGGRTFASASAVGSHYGFAVHRHDSRERTTPEGVVGRRYEFAQSSGLTEGAVRFDAEAGAGRHAVRVGVSATARRFVPVRTGTQTARDGVEVISNVADEQVWTAEGAVYAEDEVTAGPVRANGGLRWSAEASGGVVTGGPEPRLGVRVAVTPEVAVTASGARMRQGIHLLTNSGVGLPTDLWVPATAALPPERAWTLDAGAEWARGPHGVTVGVYTTWQAGVIEYADGVGFFSPGPSWDAGVLSGTGRATGLEVGARTARGRLSGAAAYTLARATRRVPGVEGGRPFPARYGRPHTVTADATWAFSSRRRITLALMAHTGAAATVPVGSYWGDAGLTVVLTPRNAGRFPVYFRLDAAYEAPLWGGQLTLGLYNATNRLNPFFLDVERTEVVQPDGSTLDVNQARGTALFPVLPSISYSVPL